MNRPELTSVSISPNPANAKAALTVTIGVDDIEIIFGTEYYYAGNNEIYAGEEGVI